MGAASPAERCGPAPIAVGYWMVTFCDFVYWYWLPFGS